MVYPFVWGLRSNLHIQVERVYHHEKEGFQIPTLLSWWHNPTSPMQQAKFFPEITHLWKLIWLLLAQTGCGKIGKYLTAGLLIRVECMHIHRTLFVFGHRLILALCILACVIAGWLFRFSQASFIHVDRFRQHHSRQMEPVFADFFHRKVRRS